MSSLQKVCRPACAKCRSVFCARKKRRRKKRLCLLLLFISPFTVGCYRKRGGLKQQTVRGFVAVLNSLCLTVIKRRTPVLGRNDRKVSLMCTRCISCLTLFAFLCAFFLPPGLETRAASAAAQHRGFDVSFSSRWKNRHTWRISQMYTRYMPISLLTHSFGCAWHQSERFTANYESSILLMWKVSSVYELCLNITKMPCPWTNN